MVRGFRPVVLLLALACGHAAGDAALRLEIAGIEGEGWHAAGVQVSLRRDDAGRLSAQVSAARLGLPAPIGSLDHVHGECRALVVTQRRFSCHELVLGIPGSTPAPLRLQGRLDYRRDTGAVEWDLAFPAEQPGTLRVSGRLEDAGWVVELAASDWPVEALAPLAALLGPPVPPIAGHVDLALVARGRDAALQGLVFELLGKGLSGANDEGTLAVEGLRLQLRGSAWPDGEHTAFDVRGTATDGEVYMEPVYASLEAHPLRLTARGTAGRDSVSLARLIVEQQDTAHVDASAEFMRTADQGWRLGDALVRLPRAELPGAYAVLLQPFLAGTPLGELDTSGLLRGELTVSDGALDEAWLELIQVNLDDRAARLAVYRDCRANSPGRPPR
jgi:hypothetical protein